MIQSNSPIFEKHKEEQIFTKGSSQFITKTDYGDLPGEVVTAAKFAVLDFVGVAMAGRIISELVRKNRSAPEATVIGWRYKASRSLVALANGSAGHVLDYDDCLDFPDAGLAHPTTTRPPERGIWFTRGRLENE